MRPRAPSPAALAVPGALLLLAFFLRFHLLSAQSLWNDEGNSARIAERSVRLILEGAAGDIHPPGYYLLLAGWRALAGESEFALRSFSALAGVALAALVYRLGRIYFDRAAALGAAAFAAVHPALIYYSQEARMYSLAATLGAGAFLLMARWLRSTRLKAQFSGLRAQGARGKAQGARRKAQEARHKTQDASSITSAPVATLPSRLRITFYALRFTPTGLAYILATALGLYTHYAFGFVLLAVNLAALGGMAFHRRELFRGRATGWLGLQAGALLLYAPWLPVAVRHLTTWPAGREALPFWEATAGAGGWLAFGPTLPAAEATAGALVVLFLLVVALRRGGQTITPLLWLAVPVGLTLGFGLFSEAFAKFLLLAVPALCLYLGHGAAAIVRLKLPGRKPSVRPPAVPWLTSGLAALAALVTLGWMAVSLRNLYFDPAYTRADYRSMARRIQAEGGPGAGVLLVAPNQWEVFTYYHRAGAPVYPLPRQRPPDPDLTTRELAQIAGSHDRLYALWWGEAQADPARIVETWLSLNAFPAADEWHGDVRLSLYGAGASQKTPPTPSGAVFGDAITLESFTLRNSSLAPGDILKLTLAWRSATLSGSLPAYKVFVHLTAPDSFPLAQHDAAPGAGLRPAAAWQGGAVVQDNHGLLLPPDLPPGRYPLLVGLYDPQTGARLPVSAGGEQAGDSLLLALVQVE